MENTNSINVTSVLHLDNSTHLTIEKTPDNSEIPKKNNAQITEEDNNADISDPQTLHTTFKRSAPESTCSSTPPSPMLTSHIPESGVDIRTAKKQNFQKSNHEKN